MCPSQFSPNFLGKWFPIRLCHFNFNRVGHQLDVKCPVPIAFGTGATIGFLSGRRVLKMLLYHGRKGCRHGRYQLGYKGGSQKENTFPTHYLCSRAMLVAEITFFYSSPKLSSFRTLEIYGHIEWDPKEKKTILWNWIVTSLCFLKRTLTYPT